MILKFSSNWEIFLSNFGADLCLSLMFIPL